MTVLAHAGHWLLQLAYASPVLLIVALVLIDRIRSRASDGEPDDPI